MLKWITKFEDLNFPQLMALYAEGNEENAESCYPALPKEDGIKKVEAEFCAYLRDDFFQKAQTQYALWLEDGDYVSALRLEPYRDGLLIEALETKPSRRRQGYAVRLLEAVKQAVSLPLYSHISKRNTASLRTHEKCGFVRISESAQYADGTINEHCCTMRLSK